MISAVSQCSDSEIWCARSGICSRAARLFGESSLPLGDEAQSPEDYVRQVSATTGLPNVMVRRNMQKIRTVLADIEKVIDGLTRHLATDVFDAGYAGDVSYFPRSDSLGVVLPSNSQGVHSLWIPAFAMKTPEGQPEMRFIFVRGLTDKTHGNAAGIGLADFTTTRLVRAMNYQATVINCLTSGYPDGANLPVHLDSDREVIDAAATDGRPGRDVCTDRGNPRRTLGPTVRCGRPPSRKRKPLSDHFMR